MPRLKSVYRCQECGYSAPKPMGQCPDCRAWNAMIEEVVEARPEALVALSNGKAPRAAEGSAPRAVSLKDALPESEPRTATSVDELDRLLGGGVVPGQVILLAGPPGIGKSTLMLQTAASLARQGKVLYVSGEESLKQVSARARRLGIASDSIYLLCETSLARVLESVREIKPRVLILDSVQTAAHPGLEAAPGTISQVRECAAELVRLAKSSDAVVFLLGHVTKEGTLAGPKVLEHIVDTVLYFDTERHDLLRALRATKNRFGPTDELGLFQMGEKGLEEASYEASSFFVEEGSRGLAGRAVSAAMEGSRPLLVELQSLVIPTRYPLPRRMATGLDLNRVLVLLAALEKHLRLKIENHDVFVSLSGGLRLKDPALDLAACMAVVSSSEERALPSDCAFIGEVGLLGETLRVPRLGSRLKEAARAGFKRAFVPARSLKDLETHGLAVTGIADLRQAYRALFGEAS